jgi:hypothetical protein
MEDWEDMVSAVKLGVEHGSTALLALGDLPPGPPASPGIL